MHCLADNRMQLDIQCTLFKEKEDKINLDYKLKSIRIFPKLLYVVSVKIYF